jgi:NADH:ubiquinone oxidoreductase subunit H
VNALLVLITAVAGVSIVEMLDRRTLLAPVIVVREALASRYPDVSLGSPRWVVGAALALPVFALAAASMLPLRSGYEPADAVPGIFLAAMLLDFASVCIAAIGWSTNRPSGVAGLFGAILQFVSYGIVIGFGMIGPAMAAGSLAPARIAAAQHVWYALTQPGSLALYAIGAFAQAFRPPFDVPAQAALDGLGGMPRLAFRWGLDLLAFTVAAYGAVLFFGAGGGSYGGLMLVTVLLLVPTALLRRARWSYPRTLHVFWRIAMPLALVNVVLVGVVVMLGWS